MVLFMKKIKGAAHINGDVDGKCKRTLSPLRTRFQGFFWISGNINEINNFEPLISGYEGK